MSSITEKDIEEVQENGYRIRSLKCSDGVIRKVLILSRETAAKAELRLHDFLYKSEDLYTHFYLGEESPAEELDKISVSDSEGSVITPMPPDFVHTSDSIVIPKSPDQYNREMNDWEEKLGRI